MRFEKSGHVSRYRNDTDIYECKLTTSETTHRPTMFEGCHTHTSTFKTTRNNNPVHHCKLIHTQVNPSSKSNHGHVQIKDGLGPSTWIGFPTQQLLTIGPSAELAEGFWWVSH